jgi:deoxycytidylate deaminase
MDALPRQSNPELFIGVVSATGTDLSVATQVLQEQLAQFTYRTENTHLIELLHQLQKWRVLPEAPIDERISTHMDAGNEFRTTLGSSAALALLGIGDFRNKRKNINSSRAADEPVPRCAYLLRGLKHPSEVQALRDIYDRGLILVGVYSSHQARLDYLTRRISESRHDFQIDLYRSKAEYLIHRDQEESGNRFGQNVRDTFHRADIFVDVNQPASVRASLARFVELLFGYSVHTPTRDEYGMFHAQAAALRSADMGRQVGAAIATDDGAIVAVGTNEVPKAGGGLYWELDEPDRRDFVLGYDSNDRRKRNLMADLLERLKTEGWLSAEKQEVSVEQLLELALAEGKPTSLRKAEIMNVLEFGRTVHAEMAALIDAARRGVSVNGGTLYSTTFPCHICARHIVAAGIRRVVYIEPFPKSLAAQLYPDSIAVEASSGPPKQVVFEPFVGVAPRQYMNLFSMTERKQADGSVANIDRQTATPRCHSSPPTYLRNEKSSLDWLLGAMREKGLLDA